MPDACFADPRLAAVYDTFDGDRDDLTAYLEIVCELGARSVLDIGCGTGAFAALLTEHGVRVTGVDPAAASLDVARTKVGAAEVTWVHGDATDLPPMQVDLAVMTGNVAQVFLDDEGWLATLDGIRRALTDEGHLVFESRRPEFRAWQEWARETAPLTREVPGVGPVTTRRSFTSVDLPFVSFGGTYRLPSGVEVGTESTLRFRTRDELEDSLVRAGFLVVEVRDAPDRPGRENVFIGRRTHERR